MSEIKKKTPLNVFTCLGVEIAPTDDQMARGMCPFCDKADHLYVRYNGKVKKPNGKWSVPGHWYCQACQLSGGIPRFLTTLIEYSEQTTSKDDRKSLWADKKIPPAVAIDCRVVRSHITSDWLIPTIKLDDGGKQIVSNIHRWWKAKNKLLGTDTLTLDLLGRQFLTPESRLPLWIAEGHWDWLILEHWFRATKQRHLVDIFGVPGSGSFQHDWLELLARREQVNILFDNDHPKPLKSGKIIQPGLDGVKKIVSMIDDMDDNDAPIEVKYVAWPDDLPDGFDLRDLYIARYQESRNAV